MDWQVSVFTAPSQETLDAVNAFLKENDITAKSMSPAGDWLGFQLTVSKANELFDADFNVFQHQDSGRESLVTMAYSLPSDLSQHVEVVHPAISFSNPFGRPTFSVPVKAPAPATNISSNAVPASCSSTITPACLQALYGIPATPATVSSNKLGVAGFIDQFANQQDLKVGLY